MRNIISAISFLIITSSLFSQTLERDIIKPVNLTAGTRDSAIISDMFYSKNYNVKFLENKKVSVKYNEIEKKIIFNPDMNFSGMTLIDFELNKKVYSIPARSSVQKKYKFIYKPTKKYNKLTLFGSFNGWDRGNLPMQDADGDGTFEASVPLEPGRYEYKFFGDGEEIVDPSNPDKKPNGFGDYNSLFNVPEPNGGKLFLHVAGKEITKSEIEFSFLYENEQDGNDISYSNLIPLLNNRRIPENKIKIMNGKIDLAFRKTELKGKSVIRLAVNKGGRVTNIQSIYLFDGIPAGQNRNFDWHDGIIYSLMIDRFNDGDISLNKPIEQDSLFDKANYIGGDFQGIINKLNDGYFNSLGINTIWISPVYDNPDNAYKESPAPHRWYSGYHGIGR
jgi:cyclomaltodextrinase / maltogenic alpha-amylase / neopullulanase